MVDGSFHGNSWLWRLRLSGLSADLFRQLQKLLDDICDPLAALGTPRSLTCCLCLLRGNRGLLGALWGEELAKQRALCEPLTHTTTIYE